MSRYHKGYRGGSLNMEQSRYSAYSPGRRLFASDLEALQLLSMKYNFATAERKTRLDNNLSDRQIKNGDNYIVSSSSLSDVNSNNLEFSSRMKHENISVIETSTCQKAPKIDVQEEKRISDVKPFWKSNQGKQHGQVGTQSQKLEDRSFCDSIRAYLSGVTDTSSGHHFPSCSKSMEIKKEGLKQDLAKSVVSKQESSSSTQTQVLETNLSHENIVSQSCTGTDASDSVTSSSFVTQGQSHSIFANDRAYHPRYMGLASQFHGDVMLDSHGAVLDPLAKSFKPGSKSTNNFQISVPSQKISSRVKKDQQRNKEPVCFISSGGKGAVWRQSTHNVGTRTEPSFCCIASVQNSLEPVDFTVGRETCGNKVCLSNTSIITSKEETRPIEPKNCFHPGDIMLTIPKSNVKPVSQMQQEGAKSKKSWDNLVNSRVAKPVKISSRDPRRHGRLFTHNFVQCFSGLGSVLQQSDCSNQSVDIEDCSGEIEIDKVSSLKDYDYMEKDQGLFVLQEHGYPGITCVEERDIVKLPKQGQTKAAKTGNKVPSIQQKHSYLGLKDVENKHISRLPDKDQKGAVKTGMKDQVFILKDRSYHVTKYADERHIGRLPKEGHRVDEKPATPLEPACEQTQSIQEKRQNKGSGSFNKAIYTPKEIKLFVRHLQKGFAGSNPVSNWREGADQAMKHVDKSADGDPSAVRLVDKLSGKKSHECDEPAEDIQASQFRVKPIKHKTQSLLLKDKLNKVDPPTMLSSDKSVKREAEALSSVEGPVKKCGPVVLPYHQVAECNVQFVQPLDNFPEIHTFSSHHVPALKDVFVTSAAFSSTKEYIPSNITYDTDETTAGNTVKSAFFENYNKSNVQSVPSIDNPIRRDASAVLPSNNFHVRDMLSIVNVSERCVEIPPTSISARNDWQPVPAVSQLPVDRIQSRSPVEDEAKIIDREIAQDPERFFDVDRYSVADVFIIHEDPENYKCVSEVLQSRNSTLISGCKDGIPHKNTFSNDHRKFSSGKMGQDMFIIREYNYPAVNESHRSRLLENVQTDSARISHAICTMVPREQTEVSDFLDEKRIDQGEQDDESEKFEKKLPSPRASHIQSETKETPVREDPAIATLYKSLPAVATLYKSPKSNVLAIPVIKSVTDINIHALPSTCMFIDTNSKLAPPVDSLKRDTVIVTAMCNSCHRNASVVSTTTEKNVPLDDISVNDDLRSVICADKSIKCGCEATIPIKMNSSDKNGNVISREKDVSSCENSHKQNVQPVPSVDKSHEQNAQPMPSVDNSHEQNAQPMPSCDNSHEQNAQPMPSCDNSHEQNAQPMPSCDNSHEQNTQPMPSYDNSHENAQPMPSCDNLHEQNTQPVISCDNSYEQNAQSVPSCDNSHEQNAQPVPSVDNSGVRDAHALPPVDKSSDHIEQVSLFPENSETSQGHQRMGTEDQAFHFLNKDKEDGLSKSLQSWCMNTVLNIQPVQPCSSDFSSTEMQNFSKSGNEQTAVDYGDMGDIYDLDVSRNLQPNSLEQNSSGTENSIPLFPAHAFSFDYDISLGLHEIMYHPTAEFADLVENDRTLETETVSKEILLDKVNNLSHNCMTEINKDNKNSEKRKDSDADFIRDILSQMDKTHEKGNCSLIVKTQIETVPENCHATQTYGNCPESNKKQSSTKTRNHSAGCKKSISRQNVRITDVLLLEAKKFIHSDTVTGNRSGLNRTMLETSRKRSSRLILKQLTATHRKADRTKILKIKAPCMSKRKGTRQKVKEKHLNNDHCSDLVKETCEKAAIATEENKGNRESSRITDISVKTYPCKDIESQTEQLLPQIKIPENMHEYQKTELEKRDSDKTKYGAQRRNKLAKLTEDACNAENGESSYGSQSSSTFKHCSKTDKIDANINLTKKASHENQMEKIPNLEGKNEALSVVAKLKERIEKPNQVCPFDDDINLRDYVSEVRIAKQDTDMVSDKFFSKSRKKRHQGVEESSESKRSRWCFKADGPEQLRFRKEGKKHIRKNFKRKLKGHDDDDDSETTLTFLKTPGGETNIKSNLSEYNEKTRGTPQVKKMRTKLVFSREEFKKSKKERRLKQCVYCGEMNKEVLHTSHMKKFHPHHCAQCQKDFQSKKFRWEHYLQTHVQQTYPCGPCDRKFISKLVFERHLASAAHRHRISDILFQQVAKKSSCSKDTMGLLTKAKTSSEMDVSSGLGSFCDAASIAEFIRQHNEQSLVLNLIQDQMMLGSVVDATNPVLEQNKVHSQQPSSLLNSNHAGVRVLNDTNVAMRNAYQHCSTSQLSPDLNISSLNDTVNSHPAFILRNDSSKYTHIVAVHDSAEQTTAICTSNYKSCSGNESGEHGSTGQELMHFHCETLHPGQRPINMSSDLNNHQSSPMVSSGWLSTAINVMADDSISHDTDLWPDQSLAKVSTKNTYSNLQGVSVAPHQSGSDCLNFNQASHQSQKVCVDSILAAQQSNCILDCKQSCINSENTESMNTFNSPSYSTDYEARSSYPKSVANTHLPDFGQVQCFYTSNNQQIMEQDAAALNPKAVYNESVDRSGEPTMFCNNRNSNQSCNTNNSMVPEKKPDKSSMSSEEGYNLNASMELDPCVTCGTSAEPVYENCSSNGYHGTSLVASLSETLPQSIQNPSPKYRVPSEENCSHIESEGRLREQLNQILSDIEFSEKQAQQY